MIPLPALSEAARTKPLWLRILTPGKPVVAWAPHLYLSIPFGEYTNAPFSWPILQHEASHLKSQIELGRARWIFRLLTSRIFRLEEEARAVAAELQSLPIIFAVQSFDGYVRSLGHDYDTGRRAIARNLSPDYRAAMTPDLV
jgi:hypothetical protein